MMQAIFRILVLLIIASTLLNCSVSKSSVGKRKKPEFTSLDKLADKMATRPRPIVLFLHAPWCKFCENMKHTTFRDETVVDVLNQVYYAVSFDGMTDRDIVFNQETYHFTPTGSSSGQHQFVEKYGVVNNAITYPTVVIFNKDYSVRSQHSGFMTAQELLDVLD